MNNNELVKLIRTRRGLQIRIPECQNGGCQYLKEIGKRSLLTETYHYVDVNGYTVDWGCPYCDYKTITGNKHIDVEDLLTLEDGAKVYLEIQHLLFNPQGVYPE